MGTFGPGKVGGDLRGEVARILQRSDFGKNSGARIAGAFGAIPEFLIFGEVNFGLAGFGLGFLQAEDVGHFGVDEGLESPPAEAGTQTINVPRENSHSNF